MEFAGFADVRADEEDLAFGSLYLVEAFLKRYRGAK